MPDIDLNKFTDEEAELFRALARRRRTATGVGLAAVLVSVEEYDALMGVVVALAANLDLAQKRLKELTGEDQEPSEETDGERG